jgi:DNA-binding SARP family transcriptional activator
MDFRLLGAVEVLSRGQALPLGGQRQRALVAYLLLHANEVVSARELIDELWEEPPRGGVSTLHTQVFRLRSVVGNRIVTAGPGYSIRVEPGELDLERFRSLLADAGSMADPVARGTTLRAADGVWHGTPLSGVNAPFASREAAALEELRLAAVEDRVEAELEQGRHAQLAAELSSLVARHPLRERLREQLILALYRSGRQADALEAYRETRRTLSDELGLEPGPALRELEQAILRHDPALAATAPVRSLPAGPVVSRRRGAAQVAAAATVIASAVGAAVALMNHDDHASQGAPARTAHVVTKPPAQPVRHTTPRSVKRPGRHAATSNIAKKASARPADERTARPRPHAGDRATPSSTRPTTTAKSTTTTAARKTVLPPTRHPAKPRAKPVTISDSFDADYADPTIWHQVTTDENVSIAEQGGQLVVTVGANAARAGTYNQIDVHVGTQCSFPGDFDARVDFKLLEWPSAANILIGLNAIYTASFAGRQSRAQAGDTYSGWVGTSFGSVPLPDTQGSLRIVRAAGVATSYFWHNGRWARLASGSSAGTAVFGLGAQSASADTEFNNQEVKIAFDNFSVTASDPICPTGTVTGG